jgi:hypothetical protein
MKPISAPQLIENGIAVYVPPIVNYPTVKLSIYYSATNPLFSWSFCEESPQKIWEKEDVNYDKGIIFIYRTNTYLKKGFYNIEIKAKDESLSGILSGSSMYGILEDKKRTLYVGFPYSTFSPINVS